MTGAWESYLRWNSAICETVFTEQQAGQPVYLDMDEGVLSTVASRVAVSLEDAPRNLTEAVRSTLALNGSQNDIFRAHLQHLARWRRTVRVSESQGYKLEPPPTIALLAVFSLAAEAMGSDTSFAVHAYYPRLASVLGIAGEKERERLRLAYQSAAEQLWRGLNDWLTLADGRYGVPTAYALTHRYVGLPLSQALIRAADRRHLTRMFRQFGLPPGSDLPPADMARMLDIWLQQVPCPASKNLQSLWQRAGARERIAEVASTELINWDTTLADGAVGSPEKRAGDINLVAQLRRFPKLALQLSFLATMPAEAPPEELRVPSAEGAPWLEMLPLAGGSVRPRSASDIDPKSMAEGVLHVTDPRTDVDAKRYPRRVVPLRRDEQANAFVECERVQLGEDFLLLIKNEGSLPSEVVRLLETVARPGYSTWSAMPGLPDGWALVADLQILAAPASNPGHPDLNALVPVIASQLNIAGGLKLPGNLRKWSSLCPPEVRAVSQVDGELQLTVTRTQLDSGEANERHLWRNSRGVLLVDLAEQGLEDGDYELKLDSSGKALQRSVLRLRSSDTPDRWSWETAPPLTYNMGTPLGVLSADGVQGTAGAGIRGALSPRCASGQSMQERRDVGKVWWSASARVRRAAVPIVIATPDPTSCVVTGAHRMQLPPALGPPRAVMTQGTCTQCGLIKRYPTWPRPRRTKTELRDLELDRTSRLSDLAEAEVPDITRDDALDALVHVGGGTASSLERIVTQVDPSAIATDAFRRNLEALGHLDVSRDERLEVSRWTIAPPCIAEAADKSFFLSGAWSDAARAQLAKAVDEAGGKCTYDDNNAHGPTTWFVEDLTSERVEEVVGASDLAKLFPFGLAPQIVRSAAMAMLGTLPPLSTVAQELPRVPVPGTRRIERFHIASASWEAVHTTASPGAYRLESAFRTLYLFRADRDVDNREVVIGTAQLVKHLEALRTGRPLLAYYPDPMRLAVPLGADLPGLYARAAVLNSGRLPGTAKNSRALVYHDVPQQFVSRLSDLLAT